MCDSDFVIVTYVGYGIGVLAILFYLSRLGSEARNTNIRHIVLSFTALSIVATCLGLHMASPCPMSFVNWGAVETAILTYLFLAEVCKYYIPD